MKLYKMRIDQKLIVYALLTFFGFLLLAPFVFMISVALASDDTTMKTTFTFIPREFHFENFIRIFSSDFKLGRFFLNSLKLVFFAIIGQLFASGLAAYAFARLRAGGKTLIFMILLSTMMIPGQVTMIPQFVLFKHLGWMNTLLPIIVPNFFGGAYNIFLIRQFISRIPVSLDESAQLEGCSFFTIYTRIIMPLITPVLAAIAIFTFSWNWGYFMGPLIYVHDVAKMPLALGVQILSATSNAGQTPAWNMVMVASFMLTIPMILVYFFGQKYIYQIGITASGSDSIK